MERKNVTFTSLDYYHYVQGRSYRVVPVVRGPPCAQPNQSSSVELGLERSACVPLGLLRTAFRHRPSWEFAHSRRLRPAAPFYSSPCGHAVKPLGAGDAVRWRAQPSLIWDSTTANAEQLPSWYVHLNPEMKTKLTAAKPKPISLLRCCHWNVI